MDSDKNVVCIKWGDKFSADYVNDSRSSIVDSLSTMVVNSNLLKIYAWYDNEWGYSCRLADLTEYVIKKEI